MPPTARRRESRLNTAAHLPPPAAPARSAGGGSPAARELPLHGSPLGPAFSVPVDVPDAAAGAAREPAGPLAQVCPQSGAPWLKVAVRAPRLTLPQCTAPSMLTTPCLACELTPLRDTPAAGPAGSPARQRARLLTTGQRPRCDLRGWEL